MIRARLQMASGRSGLLLGITDENIARLRDGKPIRVDGRPLGVDVDVMICHGADETAIVAALRAAGLIRDDTITVADTPDGPALGNLP